MDDWVDTDEDESLSDEENNEEQKEKKNKKKKSKYFYFFDYVYIVNRIFFITQSKFTCTGSESYNLKHWSTLLNHIF